jgi:hypothetical protein
MKIDEAAMVEEGGLSDPNHVELHRALKARHITMIGMSAPDLSVWYTNLTCSSYWWRHWYWFDHWNGRGSCKVSIVSLRPLSEARN